MLQTARLVGGRAAGSCLRASTTTTILNRPTPHTSTLPSAAISTPNANTRCRGLTVGPRSGEQVQVPDVYTKPTPSNMVASVQSQHNSHMLQVTWGDGSDDFFPYVWLRDNCQCSSCFHPVALSRMFQLKEIQLSEMPLSLQVAKDGAGVDVTWPDNHVSSFSASWLRQRSFKESSQDQNEGNYRVPRVMWDSMLTHSVPKASFSALLEDDTALHQFLREFEGHGVAVVTDTPTTTGQLHHLTQRVGHLVPSHYGETFHVMTKSDPSNLAYTSGEIDLHCDLPSRPSKPEIQLLHCIAQTPSEGGDNLLSDSLHAANRFRLQHPDKFHLLTTTQVEFCDRGNDEGHEFDIVHREPIITLDCRGEVKTVTMHTMTRTPFLGTSVTEVAAWYDALKTFHEFLVDPQNSFYYKMNAGDILAMDNHRLLHGRSSYRATAGGTRHLEGGYWAWAEVSSKRRVLQQKLGL